MDNRDTLLCIFSFNMGHALQNCLNFIPVNCSGFDIILVDDNSSDNLTKKIIENNAAMFKAVVVNRNSKSGKKHGNLYENIQNACDYARREGYKYIFLIQDDMQFVRPLSVDILAQYSDIFEKDEYALQVDPRFLRAGKFEILHDLKAYQNDVRTSYADVGIVHLERLEKSGWVLREGERINREGLADLGYRRYFPFTPVIMHVPFPTRYRNGKRRTEIYPFNRGKYGYHQMSAAEMSAMDRRQITELPFFRRFLRVRNMHLSLALYKLRKDSRVLA